MKRIAQWIQSSTRTVSPLLLVAVVVVLLGSTTAVALTVTDTNPTKVSLFSSESEESDFEAETLTTDITSPHTATVEVELNNTADSTASADVRVQLLDKSETVIAEEQFETGSVDPGAVWDTQVSFDEKGLTGQYEETVVVVNQD